MKNTIESFQQEVDCVNDESEIDGLCISWLRMVAMDNGKEGKAADKLLDCIELLLSI